MRRQVRRSWALTNAVGQPQTLDPPAQVTLCKVPGVALQDPPSDGPTQGASGSPVLSQGS